MMAKPKKTLELHFLMIQFLINSSYVTLSRGIPWNIPRATCILSVYKRAFRWVSVTRKYQQQLGYSVTKYEITILYHAIEYTVANTLDVDMRGEHDGKVGDNSYRRMYNGFPAFWLAFLWHGINDRISHQHEPFSCSYSNHSIHTVSCGHWSQKCQHGG